MEEIHSTTQLVSISILPIPNNTMAAGRLITIYERCDQPAGKIENSDGNFLRSLHASWPMRWYIIVECSGPPKRIGTILQSERLNVLTSSGNLMYSFV
jgi:hypothetical protein